MDSEANGPAWALRALVRGEHVSEREFDLLFPAPARKWSRMHWTPLAVARRAAALLVDVPGARVLDVGAGAGKLCLVGALTTSGSFTGIEQDTELVSVARELTRRHRVERLRFLQGDALALDWQGYDALYFFNPFANAAADEAGFVAVIRAATAKLARLPTGTRVVTYHGFGGQMPPELVQAQAEVIGPGVLQLWIRA